MTKLIFRMLFFIMILALAQFLFEKEWWLAVSVILGVILNFEDIKEFMED